MRSPSKGAPIYYMTARVAFKKKKVVHERVVWVVSVFESPHAIASYDAKTMTRLKRELFGKNLKSEKHIIIRDIVSKKFISNSILTIDEHKKQYQEQMQGT